MPGHLNGKKKNFMLIHMIKLDFEIGIKLRCLEMGRLSWVTQNNPMSRVASQGSFCKKISEREDKRMEAKTVKERKWRIACYEYEERAHKPRNRDWKKRWKGARKQMLLSNLQRNKPYQHLDFSPVKLTRLLTSGTGKRTNFCCTKPLEVRTIIAAVGNWHWHTDSRPRNEHASV